MEDKKAGLDEVTRGILEHQCGAGGRLTNAVLGRPDVEEADERFVKDMHEELRKLNSEPGKPVHVQIPAGCTAPPGAVYRPRTIGGVEVLLEAASDLVPGERVVVKISGLVSMSLVITTVDNPNHSATAESVHNVYSFKRPNGIWLFNSIANKPAATHFQLRRRVNEKR